jgi:hypothetical protein
MAFDVLAARAQRLEARGERWPFVVGDDTYTFPTELDDEHLDALEKSEGGNVAINTVRVLMGDEAYADMRAKYKLSIADHAAILDAYNRENAITVGEDSASDAS